MRERRALAWLVGIAVLVAAVLAVVPTVDLTTLGRIGAAVRAHPAELALVVVVYAGAFALRAAAWRRVLPGLGFGHALAAIHVSLAGNHLLPLRLGEALRVTSVVRRAGVPTAYATASTVTLRAADVMALGLLAVVTGPGLAASIAGPALLVVVTVVALAGAAGLLWLRRLIAAGAAGVRMPGLRVWLPTLAAWLLEAAVIAGAARWAGVELGFSEAILVTVVTIAAQVAAVAPGGFGTYEAAATVALAATAGVPAGTGLAIALTAHAVKTIYALATGAVAAVWPAPGLLGRVRLPRRPGRPPAQPPVRHDAPILLFVPAHDEEDTVAAVSRLVPDTVLGHTVEFLVVDDGSTDATRDRAQAAGAEVRSFDANRGLGAAVREGLAEGVRRGAAVVAFCDADLEYDPRELERLAAPILKGRADYVVGSRFSGDIERMLPHRRVGNRLLTWLLRFVSRAPVTDGQSGYRALSAAAARDAEIVHDFNYAQVLTLDLLLKGYRYAEVPITYRFRSTGRSYVRLGRYLRKVVPAVHRVVNSAAARG